MIYEEASCSDAIELCDLPGSDVTRAVLCVVMSTVVLASLTSLAVLVSSFSSPLSGRAKRSGTSSAISSLFCSLVTSVGLFNYSVFCSITFWICGS